MLDITHICDKVYRVCDDNYTVERCPVIMNCIEKIGLSILDYKVSLNVLDIMGDVKYSYDFQLFNLDEPIENVLNNLDTLFKENIEEINDKFYNYHITIIGLKEFKIEFPLKEEFKGD